MKAPVSVLVCAHARDVIEPAGLRTVLPDDVALVWVDELCERPDSLGASINPFDGAIGVVVGICGSRTDDPEYAVHARRAGLDPFGLQIIPLGESPVDGQRTVRTLRAAAARASAYGGSLPANSKTVLPGMNGLVSRRALFTLPPIRYVATPTVDTSLCAAGTGCNICVGRCPHDALAIAGDTVTVDRERCKSCGICVAACPQRAFEFPGNSAAEIEAETSEYLSDIGAGSRAIEFVCRNAELPPLDDGVDRVSVACAGMVPASALLGSIAGGASVVSVRPCGDRCPNGGDTRAAENVDYSQSILGAVHDDPSVVQLNVDTPVAFLESGDLGGLGKVVTEQRGTVTLPELYGARSAAETIVGIADLDGVDEAVIKHENSPLGIVTVDQDSCTACGTCVAACPLGALQAEEVESHWTLRFDPTLCVACGECTAVCPEIDQGAISVARVTDVGAIRAGITTLIESDMIKCNRCGDPISSERVLQRLTRMLGDDESTSWMRELCVDCRALGT